MTVADAKAHMRIDGTAEDVLIASLILTSRLHIEAALGLALITQGWKLLLDRWPKEQTVPLPLYPVQAVASVKVYATDGSPTTIAAGDYLVDTASRPGRLVANGVSWPAPGKAAGGIEVALTAGYGAAATDVPAPIRQALLLLVAHWYEHRDPIEIGTDATIIPAAVSELLKPYRMRRL